jgi:hypothetical protein
VSRALCVARGALISKLHNARKKALNCHFGTSGARRCINLIVRSAVLFCCDYPHARCSTLFVFNLASILRCRRASAARRSANCFLLTLPSALLGHYALEVLGAASIHPLWLLFLFTPPVCGFNFLTAEKRKHPPVCCIYT